MRLESYRSPFAITRCSFSLIELRLLTKSFLIELRNRMSWSGRAQSADWPTLGIMSSSGRGLDVDQLKSTHESWSRCGWCVDWPTQITTHELARIHNLYWPGFWPDNTDSIIWHSAVVDQYNSKKRRPDLDQVALRPTGRGPAAWSTPWPVVKTAYSNKIVAQWSWPKSRNLIIGFGQSGTIMDPPVECSL